MSTSKNSIVRKAINSRDRVCNSREVEISLMFATRAQSAMRDAARLVDGVRISSSNTLECQDYDAAKDAMDVIRQNAGIPADEVWINSRLAGDKIATNAALKTASGRFNLEGYDRVVKDYLTKMVRASKKGDIPGSAGWAIKARGMVEDVSVSRKHLAEAGNGEEAVQVCDTFLAKWKPALAQLPTNMKDFNPATFKVPNAKVCNSKFKIGDRVKIVGQFADGATYRIADIVEGGGEYLVKSMLGKHSGAYFSDKDLVAANAVATNAGDSKKTLADTFGRMTQAAWDDAKNGDKARMAAFKVFIDSCDKALVAYWKATGRY